MKCHHDPKETTGPIGMYHCPDCGVMVLAGVEHPDICEHGGYPDYSAICSTCTPGWEEELERCNQKLGKINE